MQTTIRTILHPTDFSENSRLAFDVACSLARACEAKLVMLHVIYPSSAPLADVPPNPLEPAELQEQVVGRLPWPEFSDRTLHVEHRVAEGDAVSEIVSSAHNLDCDLIVMGTHGRTGIRRLLAGSVAEGTLREADCPVLTVRAPLRPQPVAAPAPRPGPGEVVDLQASVNAKALSQSVCRAGGVEIMRVAVPAGAEMTDPASQDELIVQCLKGKVVCRLPDDTKTLHAGELVHLPACESRHLRAIEDSSLLVTVPHGRQRPL
jgi:nucleotide-binding universal stress UspA family protein/quercetin dioxygenase-like cupin family protein